MQSIKTMERAIGGKIDTYTAGRKVTGKNDGKHHMFLMQNLYDMEFN